MLSMLVTSCASKEKVEHRFCQVTPAYSETGVHDINKYQVDRVCLRALQKRLDAAYGE